MPVAEFVLGKRRILESTLTSSSGAPVCTAQTRRLITTTDPARNIDREQGARLAAILPAPLKRRPERMNRYSAIVLERMSQVGGDRAASFVSPALGPDQIVVPSASFLPVNILRGEQLAENRG